MFKTYSLRLKFKKKYFSTSSVGLQCKIPEAPRPSLLSSLINLISHEKALNLHEYVDKNHKKLGPIYRDSIGPVSAVFLSSPEGYQKVFRNEGATPRHFLPEAWSLYNEMRNCKRGLLFMDGEEWLHYRKIINKLMVSPYSLREVVVKSSQEASLSLCQEWKSHANSGKNIPAVEQRLYRWSIEVIMSILVGSSWKSYEKIARDEAEKLAGILHKIFELSARLSVLPAKYAMKFRLPVWREFVEVADEALGMTRKLIPEMASLGGGDGLLYLMKQEGIQDEDLVRIVTDLILAAGDTTAYSTQWALFLLSTHPDIQDKFAQQVSGLNEPVEIIGNSYARGILKESLRLYPTAPFLSRILPDDCTICGHTVSQGDLVIMSLYSSSRSPDNFYQPGEFIPERWLRNEKGHYNGVHNALASVPFALGVRSCIGKKLAETQMILMLAELAKNFVITCSNASRIKLKLHLIGVPSEPILFNLSKR